jgi:hypothetical protein
MPLQGHGGPLEGDKLDELYAVLPVANFSVEVLQWAQGLAVAAAPVCGWSDWGTPQRVLQSLAGSPALDLLERRILAGTRGEGVAAAPATA